MKKPKWRPLLGAAFIAWLRVSQWGFPFSLPSHGYGHAAMARARTMARKQIFSAAPFYKRLPAKALMCFAWPIGAAQTVMRNLNHPNAKQSGLSKFRLAADAYWHALRHNVPPLEYFTYRLWQPDQRKVINDFVYWTEVSHINNALNQLSFSRETSNRVSDKIAFFEFCRWQNIPTVEVLAVYGSGQILRSFRGGTVPQHDLWLKPAQAKAGMGAERWSWSEGTFRDGRGVVLDDHAMDEHIADHSRIHGQTLVQQVVANHPEIEPFTNGALAAARIITGCNIDGTTEALVANMCFPSADRIVLQGGLISLIDIATGQLGAALDLAEQLSHHPTTAAPIEGVHLPDWKQAVEAVCQAHKSMADHVFLGWDVAFSPTGPLLLETNAGWGAIHLQILMGKPLGQTRFVDVLEQYV